jgi:acyl carrier protein
MNDSIEQRVRRVAADVFNLPLEKVTRETSPDSVGNWDSVQQLNFILALEAAVGVQLEPQDVEEMRSVGAAMDIVSKKIGDDSEG